MDPVDMSNFWKQIKKTLGTDHRLYSSYHPTWSSRPL